MREVNTNYTKGTTDLMINNWKIKRDLLKYQTTSHTKTISQNKNKNMNLDK